MVTEFDLPLPIEEIELHPGVWAFEYEGGWLGDQFYQFSHADGYTSPTITGITVEAGVPGELAAVMVPGEPPTPEFPSALLVTSAGTAVGVSIGYVILGRIGAGVGALLGAVGGYLLAGRFVASEVACAVCGQPFKFETYNVQVICPHCGVAQIVRRG